VTPRDRAGSSGDDEDGRRDDDRHTRIDERHDIVQLTEIVDRHGFVHARLSWNGDVLVELVVAGAIIRGAIIDDPLLGRAHEIVAPDGFAIDASVATAMSAKSSSRVLTTISTIDWARPTEIPAIAAPGALPPGAGGAIMNALAILAQRAGVTELRYAGPYPTHALFSTLARSFRTATTEDEFTSAFADRAARVARDPMDAVFVPAPHERIAIVRDHDAHRTEARGGLDARDGNVRGDEGIDRDVRGIEHDDVDLEVRGIVEIRDGIERATIDSVTYVHGDGVARLVVTNDVGEIKPHADDARTANDAPTANDARTIDARTANDARTLVRAEVWFADELYARVATLDARGELLDGPHPIRACDSDIIGNAFPPDMAAALAELIADLVPAPLATAASDVVTVRTLRWADLGARAAARVGDELHVHAALWRVSRFGMARLAMALVEALVPVVTPLAAARYAEGRSEYFRAWYVALPKRCVMSS